MALTPEQIDTIADRYLVGIFQEMEQDVLADIARRVRKTGRLTETAELMAQNMSNQGFSPAEIRAEVMKAIKADASTQAKIASETLKHKKYVAARVKEIVEEAKRAGNELVANAGKMCFNDDLSLWEEAGKKLTNTALPQIVEAVQKQTWGAMKNLTQTTALGLRDAAGTPIKLMDAYHRLLDKATLEMASGTFSYDEAVNRVIREMANSGVRFIEYHSASGRTTMTELDVAVRRNVRTGLSQMAGKIMEENLRSSDVDLVITSQHMGSRPEHAGWQNRIFSFSGKSKRYKSLEEGTGYGTVTGLMGANCSHSFYPYWPGISVREPDLKEPPPVDINGRKYTYYQATQKQRAYERKLRSLKRETLIQENSGGDPVKISELKRQTQAMSREYNSFSRAAGLRPKPNRARVVGFDRGGDGVPTKPTANIKRFTNPYTGQAIDIEKSRFSQIRKVCGDEFTDGFMEHLDKCSDLTQALFHKFGDKLAVVDKDYQFGAYFSLKEGGVAFDAKTVVSNSEFMYTKPYQTVIHEFSHMVDYLIGPGGSAPISNNTALYSLLKDEGKKFEKLCYRHLGFDSKPWDAKFHLAKAANQIFGTDSYFDKDGHYVKGREHVLFGVSDVLEPIINIMSPLGDGHGKKYWGTESSGDRRINVCTEFMSHVLEGDIAVDGYSNAMKTVFPDAHSKLTKMLWEALSQ